MNNYQLIKVEPLSPKGERFLLHRLSNEMSPQAFNVRSSRPRQSLGYRDGDMLAESVSLSKGAIHLGPEGPSFLASEDKWKKVGNTQDINDLMHWVICGQPERLNPEDASNSVCDSLNSMET